MILALPKKGSYLPNRILIDENKKVMNSNNDEPLRTQYDYCDIPILFCPKAILSEIAIENDVSSFVLKYTRENELYVEMLDRGFVEISIDRWEDVNEASTFIKIVQDKCGMNIYCIEEVAWRRGMITVEQLRSLGQQHLNNQYGGYIISLCEKI
jgi:glucose-1-phosphate thymidylyltransferase